MADTQALDLHRALVRFRKRLDAVGCEDQVQVERSRADLDEVLATEDLVLLGLGQREPKVAERLDECATVVRRLVHEEICILRGIGEAQQDGSALAEKEGAHSSTCEGLADLARLPVLKRPGHSLARTGGFAHTTGGSRPWFRTREIALRRGPA